MKRKGFFLISSAMFVIGALALVGSFRICLESALRHRAVVAPRGAFESADRFEILFLEEALKNSESRSFSVSPFRDSYRVLHVVELSGSKAIEFKELIAKNHILTKEFSAMCHTPHHAIRAFGGTNSIFEATLCLECVNMEFAAFGLIPVEVSIFQKDPSASDLPLLEDFLNELLANP